MKLKISMIKRLSAFALAVSLFCGTDGLVYASAAGGGEYGGAAVADDREQELPAPLKGGRTYEITDPGAQYGTDEFTDPNAQNHADEFTDPNAQNHADEFTDPNAQSGTAEFTDPNASNGSNGSAGQEESLIPAAPAAPRLTQLTQTDYQTICLRWETLSDVSGYIIERRDAQTGNFTRIADIQAAQTSSYRDSFHLLTGVVYEYRIYAYVSFLDENGAIAQVKGDASGTLSLKLSYTEKPASFAASSVRYDRIKLTWSAASGASGYEIYRSYRRHKGFQKIAETTGNKTSYTDQDLASGTVYYYKIRAFRSNADTTALAPYVSAVKAKPVPRAPVLKASYLSYDSVSVTWTKVAGASGYILFRSSQEDGEFKKIAEFTDKKQTSYTDSGLKSDRTYSYKIRAYRTVGGGRVKGGTSQRVSISLTLLAPTLSRITAKNYRALTLKWTRVAGANGYYIYRSASKKGTYERIASVAKAGTLAYTDNGVATGKKYYYKIKAYRKENGKKIAGSASNIKHKATALATVSDISITPLHSNRLKLEWEDVRGAKSYNIYRSAKKGGTYKLVKKRCADPVFTDTDLTNGKKYYYKVTAVRGSYEGGQSEPVGAMASFLKLSQTSVTVQKRFSITVTAVSKPKKAIKWTSSNSRVATVSSDGVIHGIGVGSATIYARANGLKRSIKVKVRQTLDGIDVSKWQGSIDFHAVRNAGYHFVMIRIYNGMEKDPNFETYYKNAIAAGLGVGVYYYSYATSVDAAKQDAEKVLEILRGRKLNYPIVIDMEDNVQLGGLTNQNRTDIAWAFCNEIAVHGYQAGLYANTYWLDNYFENERLASMNLWIARWTQDPSIWHNYSGAGNIFMWQYTSSGSVPGISGRVDLDLGFSD